ncbi:MAG: hypothetical protein E7226_03775 [Clostridiales bacterium]|nr:hypothetical protein [Clostridiales bacterium]
MESIKFNAKGHSVEFSKRTLTIDDKVYSYTGISQVKHSSAYQAYLFRYNGEWVKLFYDEPHGNVVAALFRKINAMNERRAAKARATQSIDTSAIAAALAASEEKTEEKAEEPAEEKPVEEAAEKPAEVPAEEPAKEPEVPIVEPETPAVEEEVPAEEPVVEPEAPAEEKPAEEAAEKPAVVPAEITSEEAEKKAKRKKAFIIFAVIIALFIIAGIIYFLTVGTTNDASQGPNIDETHQYNDIDELIEEMQE